MDFHSLSRRELQTLCKRNKIPANITNVAMADALSALPLVEGIDEFLSSERSGVPESPMKGEVVSSEIPRTELRTSTRRKAVKDDPITTRTRRAAAARGTEESENRDLNVTLTTPSLRSSRRITAGASSACKKVDFQMTVDEEEDNDLDHEKPVIENTPAVPKSQKRVAGASTSKRTQTRNNGAMEPRVYSTRRSVRLLEQTMESLSLAEDRKMEPITVHMSFDEMPNSAGPVKEETKLEVESNNTDKSESKLDEDLELETNEQEKNEMEEPQMDPDDSMKCSADSVEISAEEINDSDKLSLDSEDVDLTLVHHSSIEEESGMEVQSKQNVTIFELEHIIEEVKPMNISAEESSLPIENVEEETQVDDVLSSVEESVMEFPENVSEDLVDVKIQYQMEESPPTDTNVDTIDSHPDIPNDILQCEEALIEVSVSSNNNGIQSLPSLAAAQLALANQFPRPSVVETKSSHKEQATRLLMDNSDAEEEANCTQKQTVEKNDMSLRQLRKMFKEQLQLNKKKMDNNNNINPKVRTALQPLPENRMAMDGLEKLF
ncbi:uncharacterized protein LOC111808107 isoform X2 [Cucurbita pepo subsp. pepo]|uniref:uncharacterized protein LOC111808107 isoform X2 n=1 Tax=Cucurbita pepo subsp. pepo TaxID=3664 RepID=UPI000C9D3AC2|nr:uncharacterized protein LOC111808107 isoform X2 [Cucurbita pepo subsp. pepo]